MNLKKLLESINKLTTKKSTFNLIVVFLVGILILIVADFFKSTANTTMIQSKEAQNNSSKNTNYSDNSSSLTAYEEQKKTELKNMLAQIQGIGKVDVMIYFDGGEELVPAINSNVGNSITKETDNGGGKREITQNNNGETVVMVNEGSDSKPFILKKVNPKITGVMVVAEGAEDKEVQLKVIKAVSGLFGILNNKVNVYPMKK